ncbi:hypothetical protein EDC96DRAFT_521951 [Choanephora cucurbitarum]|nr:hypothetical protein EDC96DRAFT_521951 [Choanephora cucurbitarum]
MAPAPSKVAVPSSALEKVKKSIEDKDWKFYCAIAAGLTLAARRGKRKPEAKREVKKTVETTTTTTSSEKSATTPAEQKTTTTTTTTTTSVVDYAALSDEEIAALSADPSNTKLTLFSIQTVLLVLPTLNLNERVIEDCNEALRLDPVYVKALNRRAHALEKKGDLENALYDFTCVCILDAFKNDAASKAMERVLKQVSENRAKEIMKTKKPRLPSPTFVTAYLDSFRPLVQDLASIPDDESGDAYYAKAYRAIAEKDYNGALEASYALNLMGTFAFLKGNTAEALTWFNKAIEADPKYVQSYIKRSSIYMEQGKEYITKTNSNLKVTFEATYKQFEEAVAINLATPISITTEVKSTTLGGNYDAAAKDYSESIKLDDSFVYAHIQLGVVQYKLGSISSSMSTFNNTLKKFANSTDVHNYYGELLVDQQKLPEAIEMFGKAMTLDPKNPLPYINKAMLMYQVLNNIEEATKLCQSALEVDPACDAAVASLAQILLEQGKPEEALKYYKMAIDLARTEAELEHAISYVEATKTQTRFAKDFPDAAAKLKALRG